MNAGDTFLISDSFGTHLNFILGVLTDGSLITCHFTTYRRHSDPTCILHPGEHPFISQNTVVRYDQAVICPPERIKNLEAVIIRRLEPLSDNLLERIRQGALDSPQTPDFIKQHLRNG